MQADFVSKYFKFVQGMDNTKMCFVDIFQEKDSAMEMWQAAVQESERLEQEAQVCLRVTKSNWVRV